jgi:hypothetical protein
MIKWKEMSQGVNKHTTLRRVLHLRRIFNINDAESGAHDCRVQKPRLLIQVDSAEHTALHPLCTRLVLSIRRASSHCGIKHII